MRLPTLPRHAVTALVITVMLLASCGAVGKSRLNPFNWFRKSEVVAIDPATQKQVDPRPLVADVISMVVEPYPGGAIVRATGLPPSQGWWDAELVALPVDEKGVLVYEFHVFPPLGTRPANLPQSREITVAASISDFRLEGVNQIVVQGVNNARSSRR